MPVPPGIRRPTFVLLHGIGLSHRSFTQTARFLAGFGDVLAFDLPGFGGTARPRHPLTVEDYAEVVATALDARRARDRLRGAGDPDRARDQGGTGGPVVVVGHSMGAQFALELALRRPDLVDAVVMIGPVVDPGKRTLWQQALRLARDAALEPFRTNMMVQFDYARCGPRWFLAETRAMLAYPTHERIGGLAKPLLVLRGGHDPIAVPQWTSWLAAQVPDGEEQSTHRFRHNVLHSSPAETAGRIIRFTRSLADRNLPADLSRVAP